MNKYPLSVVIVVLLDRIITTPFWHLETNPILLEIGIIGMWISAFILLPTLIYLFYSLVNTKFEGVAKGCCILVSGFYSLVIIGNIFTIYYTYI